MKFSFTGNSNRFKLEEKFHLADLEIKANKFESAVQLLQEIISDEPKFGKAYNHLGWLYETKFKDLEIAEKHYKLALEHAPDYTAVYKNYAILLSTLGKYDDLKVLLDKAIKVPGMDRFTVYNEYGIMYGQLEQYDMAKHYYRDAAKATMNDKTMKTAMDSIERCTIKMSL